MTRFIRIILGIVVALGFAAPNAFADQPKAWGIWTQEPASPIMTEIVDLHSTITAIILAITAFVFAMLLVILFRFHHSRHPVAQQWSHNALLEVVWTLIPVLILVGIAFPSFKLLYAMDRTEKADYTVKVTGHQWYWSYSFPDLNVNFDANMVQDDSLEPGQPRLLTSDAPLVVPVNAVIRLLTTADDVIHSWSVPAFGVKLDALPGRLNETWFKAERTGIYYGQCSQLCGINHGFMPIEVRVVEKEEFDAWVAQQTAQKTSSAAAPTKLAAASIAGASTLKE